MKVMKALVNNNHSDRDIILVYFPAPVRTADGEFLYKPGTERREGIVKHFAQLYKIVIYNEDGARFELTRPEFLAIEAALANLKLPENEVYECLD